MRQNNTQYITSSHTRTCSPYHPSSICYQSDTFCITTLYTIHIYLYRYTFINININNKRGCACVCAWDESSVKILSTRENSSFIFQVWPLARKKISPFFLAASRISQVQRSWGVLQVLLQHSTTTSTTTTTTATTTTIDALRWCWWRWRWWWDKKIFVNMNFFHKNFKHIKKEGHLFYKLCRSLPFGSCYLIFDLCVKYLTSTVFIFKVAGRR